MTPRDQPSRLQALLAGAPGWVGGVLTGVQAAALGVIVVLAPAFAAAAAAPTPNGSAEVDWMAVTALSVRMWLLGHGVPYIIDGVAFTLAPLGLTLIVAAILAAIARRFCTKSWASWAIATSTYAGLVCLAEVVSNRGYPDLANRTAQTAIVAVIIAGPAVAVGIWRAYGAEFGWVPRIALAARQGVRLGLATVAGTLAAAALRGAAFTYLGRGRIATSVEALAIDPLGGFALAFAQSLYTPNFSVWMVGWLTGHGFSVGEGSLYSPSEISADAVPAFPIFGALPTVSGGTLVWAPVVIVAIAAVSRVGLRRRISTAVADLPGIGCAAAVVAVALGVLGAVASGALGPGRLAVAGVEVVPVAVAGSILALLGFGLGHAVLLLGGVIGGRRRREPLLSVVPDNETV